MFHMKKSLLKEHVINKNNSKINKITTILIAIILVTIATNLIAGSFDFYGNNDFKIKNYLNLKGE